MPTGIYKIVNLIDGKVYVGQAINLEKRRKQHFKDLRGGYHRNLRMQRAFTRDGEANFRFEIIEECATEALTEREQYWLDFFDTRYNICPAAESMRGMKWSDESRAKRSAMLKANPMSEEHKRALMEGALKRDRSHSEETKAKIALSSKAMSQEKRAKITEGLRKKKVGVPLSEDHKAKFLAGVKGRKQTPEEKAKRVASVKATWAVKPKAKMTEEAKAKMIASQKRLWENRTPEERAAHGRLIQAGMGRKP